MNSKWVGISIVLSGVAAGCSGGRAIFNVDVFSFLSGSAKDTVQYPAVPPFTSNVSAPDPGAKKITLVPGLASSPIDTVKVSGSANVINQSGGPGTLSLQVYLASDSLGTYGAGRDSLFAPAPTAILSAGVDTVPVPLNVQNLSPSGNALFSKSAVWIRIAATVSNSGASFMQGKAVLTGLLLRVVVQDKLF
jgi:hypothetical protein